MMTIFSIPRPFEGRALLVQVNAIRSWLHLQPSCQVIVFGCYPNAVDPGWLWRLQHVPNLRVNSSGTPLLNYAFKKAHRLARFDILCYLDADVILMADFLQAVEIVSQKMRDFLIVGRRWNVDVPTFVDFERPGWGPELKLRAMRREAQQPYTSWMWSMDYFVFPRHRFLRIPAFAVGRAWSDTWMVWKARSDGIPVVDIGNFAMSLHQTHDYPHLPGGQAEAMRGEEAQENLRKAGGLQHTMSLLDATHVLTPRGELVTR